MSEIKPIKTRADYDEAIALLAELMDANPTAGSAEDTKITILSALIEDFESSTLPDYQVDPIEAIKFRLGQLGLKEKDLVPYLGTRSRVSEILSGKRALTVAMIRNLEEGLGIPASVLVGSNTEKKSKRWTPKTLTMMAKRGYFGEDNKDLPPQQILSRGLLRSIFSPDVTASASLLRQSNYRSIDNVDKYHMEAWSNKVLTEAKKIIDAEKVPPYNKSNLTQKKLSDIFKFSVEVGGVEKIVSKLKTYGIVVVIEPQLPTTRLDGATLFMEANPVIGITIRYDRLDNFWFTLAHELAHIYLHYGADYSVFYDRLFNASNELTEIETDADTLAGDLLIPRDLWKKSPLRYASTPTLVKMFAKKVGVHESVIAGRIRYDNKDWSVHSEMVNGESVRSIFGEVIW